MHWKDLGADILALCEVPEGFEFCDYIEGDCWALQFGEFGLVGVADAKIKVEFSDLEGVGFTIGSSEILFVFVHLRPWKVSLQHSVNLINCIQKAGRPHLVIFGDFNCGHYDAQLLFSDLLRIQCISFDSDLEVPSWFPVGEQAGVPDRKDFSLSSFPVRSCLVEGVWSSDHRPLLVSVSLLNSSSVEGTRAAPLLCISGKMTADQRVIFETELERSSEHLLRYFFCRVGALEPAAAVDLLDSLQQSALLASAAVAGLIHPFTHAEGRSSKRFWSRELSKLWNRMQRDKDRPTAKRSRTAFYEALEEAKVSYYSGISMPDFWKHYRRFRKGSTTHPTVDADIVEKYHKLWEGIDIQAVPIPDLWSALCRISAESRFGTSELVEILCNEALYRGYFVPTLSQLSLSTANIPLRRGKGLDGMPNILSPLTASPSWLSFLRLLYIFSMAAGVGPTSFRCSRLHLIPKAGGKLRPIQVLGLAFRGLDGAVAHELAKEGEENGLFDDTQWGFRCDRSTVDCLFVFSQMVSRLRSMGESVFVCKIDLVSAYDSVEIPFLLNILEGKINPGLVSFFRSTYVGRSTVLESLGIPISRGVQQGSCSSPSLFNLYMCDLVKAVRGCLIISYADDVLLISVSRSGLLLGLDEFCHCADKLHLSLSVDKSYVVDFSGDCVGHPSDPLIFRNGQSALHFREQLEFLGLRFCSSWNWQFTLNSLVHRGTVNFATRLGASARRYTSMRSLLLWLQAVVAPAVTYASQILSISPEVLHSVVDRQWVDWLRRVMRVPSSFPISLIRGFSIIPDLSDTIDLELLILIFGYQRLPLSDIRRNFVDLNLSEDFYGDKVWKSRVAACLDKFHISLFELNSFADRDELRSALKVISLENNKRSLSEWWILHPCDRDRWPLEYAEIYSVWAGVDEQTLYWESANLVIADAVMHRPHCFPDWYAQPVTARWMFAWSLLFQSRIAPFFGEDGCDFCSARPSTFYHFVEHHLLKGTSMKSLFNSLVYADGPLDDDLIRRNIALFTGWREWWGKYLR